MSMSSENATAHPLVISHHDKGDIAAWRQQLKDGFYTLRADFSLHPSTHYLFKQHCQLIDNLLVTVWAQMQFDSHCCLIAVGGYGRGELYPHSDIDLLILLPEHGDKHNHYNHQVETLIGMLWDIGLTVGHSVRNLQECVTEAQKDITVQTNLIESRLLTGDTDAYNTFVTEIARTLNVPAFFCSKTSRARQSSCKIQ